MTLISFDLLFVVFHRVFPPSRNDWPRELPFVSYLPIGPPLSTTLPRLSPRRHGRILARQSASKQRVARPTQRQGPCPQNRTRNGHEARHRKGPAVRSPIAKTPLPQQRRARHTPTHTHPTSRAPFLSFSSSPASFPLLSSFIAATLAPLPFVSRPWPPRSVPRLPTGAPLQFAPRPLLPGHEAGRWKQKHKPKQKQKDDGERRKTEKSNVQEGQCRRSEPRPGARSHS